MTPPNGTKQKSKIPTNVSRPRKKSFVETLLKMMLSRQKPAGESSRHHRKKKDKKKKIPSLEDLLKSRDYTGAIALLEFQMEQETERDISKLIWLCYAAFHLGDYARAAEGFSELCNNHPNPDLNWHTYLGICYFFLGRNKEAEVEASRGPASALQNRLMFHICHRTGQDDKLMQYHQQLTVESVEDQLCLASVHALRGHHQEAIDVYRHILSENRDLIALNIYISMCYYKLDYYDVSNEVLQAYLASHPSSPTGVNLKACSAFKLFQDGNAAENELKILKEKAKTGQLSVKDLVDHNMVVFRDGEDALKVFPNLVDVIPEARLNLVVHMLKTGKEDEAYELVKDLEPASPSEYVLKGVVLATIGQRTGAAGAEQRKLAQQYFRVVGTSPTERDTLHGRQCMASVYFMLQEWGDVLTYLNSVKDYFHEDDIFMYDFGVANGAAGDYAVASAYLSQVKSAAIKKDFCFVSWLIRSYIMSGKPKEAWEVFLEHENTPEGSSLLLLMAHDCYRMGFFLFSAKAFDMLAQMDPQPDHVEGRHAACVGAFQLAVAGQEPPQLIDEILQILESSNDQQCLTTADTIRMFLEQGGLQYTDEQMEAGYGGGMAAELEEAPHDPVAVVPVAQPVELSSEAPPVEREKKHRHRKEGHHSREKGEHRHHSKEGGEKRKHKHRHRRKKEEAESSGGADVLGVDNAESTGEFNAPPPAVLEEEAEQSFEAPPQSVPATADDFDDDF